MLKILKIPGKECQDTATKFDNLVAVFWHSCPVIFDISVSLIFLLWYLSPETYLKLRYVNEQEINVELKNVFFQKAARKSDRFIGVFRTQWAIWDGAFCANS